MEDRVPHIKESLCNEISSRVRKLSWRGIGLAVVVNLLMTNGAEGQGKSTPANPPNNQFNNQNNNQSNNQGNTQIRNQGNQSSNKRETERVVTSEKVRKDHNKTTGFGFSLFLGLDVGFAGSRPGFNTLENPKEGSHFAGKVLFSLFTEAATIDIGGGYLKNQLTGFSDATVDPETGEPIQNENKENISSSFYFAELSPRFRFAEHFELGLVGDLIFGSQDAGFGARTGEPRSSVFAGVQAMFPFVTEHVDFRAGLQVLTDVTIQERQVIIGLLNLQIGMPLYRQKAIVKERKVLTVKETVKTENVEKVVERVVEKVVVRDVVKFLFDGEMINFETRSSQVSQGSTQFLAELAGFLSQRNNIWGELVIEGHTDNRGSIEYNTKLSNDRAKSVRDALVQSGIDPNKIRFVGYGFSRPLERGNSPLALARNRRVEMSFSNVSDPQTLKDGIDRIRMASKR